MKNILHELYHGRVSSWERRINRSAEEKAIFNKVIEERHHFIETLSDEDSKRFENFELMSSQIHGFDEVRTFAYAFRLGALIMLAILERIFFYWTNKKPL